MRTALNGPGEYYLSTSSPQLQGRAMGFRSAPCTCFDSSPLSTKNFAHPLLSEACVRGHRATRCDHFDRWMVRVKRPGRPLRECPHATAPCSCHDDKVIMMRIPKREQSQTPLISIDVLFQDCLLLRQPGIKANNAQKENAIVANCEASIQLSTMTTANPPGAHLGNGIHRTQRERCSIQVCNPLSRVRDNPMRDIHHSANIL